MEVVDYTALPDLSRNSDEDVEESQLVEVSESTKPFLLLKCTRSVPNDKRMRVKAPFPQPRLAATRIPRLDNNLK